MKKNGFTLIELLAVIVILAFILMIAVPAVTRTITNARIHLFAVDANQILNSSKFYNDNGIVTYDPTIIDIHNVGKLFDVEANNFESVSVSYRKGQLYVIIVGKNNYDGYTAYGYKNKIEVVPTGAVYVAKVCTKVTNADTDSSCFDYTSSGGEVTITGYHSNCTKDVGVPSLIDGEFVRIIGNTVFSNNTIDSITLPSSVRTIGEGAFAYSPITTIDIPEGVETIRNAAFVYSNLECISLPSTLKVIEYAAFQENNIESVEIPDSVTIVGEYAFSGNHLTDVKLNANDIRSSAFNNNRIVNLIIGPKVTNIGYDAFRGNDLLDLTILSEYLDLEWYAFDDAFDVVGIANLTIERCNNTYSGAFPDNNFNKVTINSGVIPASFLYGSAFKSLYIGQDVESIEKNAFAYLWDVDPIDVVIEGATTIKEDAFRYTKINSLFIGDKTSSIGSMAFSNSDISTLTFENNSSLVSIGDFAFESNNFISVTIPSSVETIGRYAFQNNFISALNFEEESSLSSIGENAFYNQYIVSLELPNSVVYIGSGAFSNNQIKSLLIPNGVISIGTTAFAWNQLTNLSIPNNVTAIGSSAFAHNNLSSLTFEPQSSLTSIGATAFSNNVLTSINIPSTVTYIGPGAFNLNDVPISNAYIYSRNGNGSIDYSKIVSFAANETRLSITIPDGVVTIGEEAFQGYELASVNLANSIISIETSAFEGNKIGTLNIPSSVQNIGNRAFTYNEMYKLIFQPTSQVSNIGDFAFGANSLTSVTIPNSVVSIGTYAFWVNLFGENSVSIDNYDGNVTIGEGAFDITPNYLR